ncbi:MAG: YggT family protein [Clostridiales bacterium]|nr:YggT family protein [Clostridiales bacterium]
MAVTRVVINIINLLISACTGIIFINVILSWVLPPTHAVKQFFDFITAPILRPIRRLLQPLMAKSSIPLDLSPIVAFLLLSLLGQLLNLLWGALF